MFNLKNLSLEPEIIKSENNIIKELEKLFLSSLKKLIPNEKYGILFSGGIDSTLIAYLAKKINPNFICYTVALDESAKDLVYAEKLAKEFDFNLKIIKIKIDDIECCIKKVISAINDTSVVKVGVGLVVYIASEQAKKDGIKILLGGLGSEEIFAGYLRHRKAEDTNKECLAGLKTIYERDISRDLAIANSFNLELRAPFLDEELIKYSLRIPAKYKIKGDKIKIILRDLAKYLGIKKEYAERKRLAAQYGSKVDKAIERITRKSKFKNKSDYLKSFVKNINLGALVSGGKDSWLALWLMKQRGYNISCLLNMDSENKDSYMFHTARIDLVKEQAKQSNIPLITHKTKGEKEEELKELKELIQKAIDKYNIQGIITGALYSEYQKSRIENICKELNIKCISPLWHIDQEEELNLLLKEDFEVVIVKTAADGLDDTWIGKAIDKDMIKKLIGLDKKIGLSCAGEGGEYETIVLYMPLFSQRIKLF